MPIRINLLAEERAAEEMRRRDPVKRAIWAAGGLIALLILWSANLQFQISGKRAELSGTEGRLKAMEGDYLQVSNQFQQVSSLSRRLETLKRHATNRFLWTRPLNGLQFASVPNVRVVNLLGVQRLNEQKQVATNKNEIINLPPRSWWQWWSEPPEQDINERVANQLNSITNSPQFAPYQAYLTAGAIITTNPVQIVGKVEVIKPQTITEAITLTVRARDYSKPPESQAGAQVIPFHSAVLSAPFYKEHLSAMNSSVQAESFVLREDPTDLVSPNKPFVPVVFDGRFPERIHAR